MSNQQLDIELVAAQATAKQALAGLELYDDGRVKSPGAFEMERRYVPYFWQLFLDDAADRDDGRVIGFDVTKYDKAVFPELKHRQTVKIYQDDQGFVREV